MVAPTYGSRTLGLVRLAGAIDSGGVRRGSDVNGAAGAGVGEVRLRTMVSTGCGVAAAAETPFIRSGGSSGGAGAGLFMGGAGGTGYGGGGGGGYCGLGVAGGCGIWVGTGRGGGVGSRLRSGGGRGFEA